eukprot:TRINITY_DN1391_c0_g1_i2.p2 TRINITY_DN1391_c0_g1~~TRINITY_DN1391_c0_g1_i2.p2  ORF type:complete len:100 (+),score=15.71 TRINITY_DN1391_c0_g1_i2:184-483(+)
MSNFRICVSTGGETSNEIMSREESDDKHRLYQLVELLGAKSQDRLSKKKCTHLVSKYPRGNKYSKALEWKLAVASPDWLMACVKPVSYTHLTLPTIYSV